MGYRERFTEFKDLRKSSGFVTGISSPCPDAVMPRCIYETHIDFDLLKAHLNNT